MVICLERGADLHVAQLMPPPLTVCCFSKIQIGFTFLVLAHPGSPGKRAVKRVCVCVYVFIVVVILPQIFETTLRQYIAQGLPDLSVSRSRARIPWGIPVPGDDSQTVCSDYSLQ